ncbi:MFS transporter [Paenibacillus sp. P26]|nr:MFS transporter [Paenibacillus sp. P26]
MSTQPASESPHALKSILGPLLAIIAGMFMIILDNTVVNVALSGWVREFNTSLAAIQWAITGYSLTLAAVIPLAGWMADRFGAKRIFISCLGLFTIGSVLCGISASPSELIASRILQGLGGGMVSPIGMSLVFRLAPPGRKGTVMGMMGIPMLLAPALGPALSGWLIEYWSWHAIFLINLPVGIAAMVLGIRFLPPFERQTVPPLDLPGLLLAPLAFAALVYAVHEGERASRRREPQQACWRAALRFCCLSSANSGKSGPCWSFGYSDRRTLRKESFLRGSPKSPCSAPFC